MTWPVDHDGTTADEIPYGASVFRTIWDDHRGYDAVPVGRSGWYSGRQLIMVAVSPGAYIEAMMIGTGHIADDDIADAIRRVRQLAPVPSEAIAGYQSGPSPASTEGHVYREAM